MISKLYGKNWLPMKLCYSFFIKSRFITYGLAGNSNLARWSYALKIFDLIVKIILSDLVNKLYRKST